MLELSFGNFYKKSAFLTEGGNIFSTRRINKTEVVPTLKKAEELTGLSLIDNTLGSTGKAETSGDLDVVIDNNKTSKDEFIKQLTSKGVDPTSLKKTGIEVAYKAPIYGTDGKETGDFVQVDFMFHDDPEYLKFYYANNETSPYKGAHRNILLSAIAKANNLMLSMKGLFDRETKQLLSKEPEVIAKKVLGDTATVKDIFNVPSIIKYLKTKYSDDQLKEIVKDAEETTGMKFV